MGSKCSWVWALIGRLDVQPLCDHLHTPQLVGHHIAHHFADNCVVCPWPVPIMLARLKTGTERTALPLSLCGRNWLGLPCGFAISNPPLPPILGTHVGHTAATYLLGLCVGHGVPSGCLWVHRWPFTVCGCEWCRETWAPHRWACTAAYGGLHRCDRGQVHGTSGTAIWPCVAPPLRHMRRTHAEDRKHFLLFTLPLSLPQLLKMLGAERRSLAYTVWDLEQLRLRTLLLC